MASMLLVGYAKSGLAFLGLHYSALHHLQGLACVSAPEVFNGSHYLASVHFLLGCTKYLRFCITLIICAYVRIFCAENSNTMKFDRHLEIVILDRSNKDRHLDFYNVTNIYCTRCNRLESDMQQLYKQVTLCFGHC
jgi:hypothetical protein